MTKMKMETWVLTQRNMFIKCTKDALLLYILLSSLSSTVYANYNSYVVNPEFGEPAEELNITTFAGQTSRLPCTVKHLQGKVVSWIRGRDLQVLSTGRITFSTDLRISVLPGTKGRKHRATRAKRSTNKQWQWSKLRIWRKSHRRKRRRVQQQSIHNEINISSVTPITYKNQTRSIQRLKQRRNHIIAHHPRNKRYVKDIDTFNEYGFRDRHSDPFTDYDIDSSTKRRYQRKFLKAYSRLQDQSRSLPHHRLQDQSRSQAHHRLQDQSRLQEHKSHQGDYSDQQSLHHKQDRHYSDYGRLQSDSRRLHSDSSRLHRDYEEDLSLKPMNTVTPYSVPQSGMSQHTRAFYPPNIGDSPVHPPLQYDTPIAIYPQTYYTQDGSRKDSASSSPNYVPGVWEPEDYTLQIKFTEPGDKGLYICQINTDPKIYQNIHVKVIDMQAEIVGSSELYVKAGTPVTLTCRVNHGSTMPGFIFWYQDSSLVDYDHSGGRVQIHTGSDGTSQLHLTKAAPSDSANYTCWPSGGAKASVSLNVIIDERQAAMQQGNGAISSNNNPTWALLLTVFCYLVPLFGSHVPNYLKLSCRVSYYLLISCSGLLMTATSNIWEMLKWPKENIQFYSWFHKSSACNRHILKYISIVIASIVIYVAFIIFVPLTTYKNNYPSMVISIFLVILFSILSILFMFHLFSPPIIFSEWATVVADVMNTSGSAGCVIWSMSSLVFCCGCQRGYM